MASAGGSSRAGSRPSSRSLCPADTFSPATTWKEGLQSYAAAKHAAPAATGDTSAAVLGARLKASMREARGARRGGSPAHRGRC